MSITNLLISLILQQTLSVLPKHFRSCIHSVSLSVVELLWNSPAPMTRRKKSIYSFYLVSIYGWSEFPFPTTMPSLTMGEIQEHGGGM